jgi:urea transport system substrate-binding protein
VVAWRSCCRKLTDTEVTVGILHSATGTMAIRKPARSRPKSSPSSRSTPPAACSAARSSSSRKTAPATGRPSPRRPRSCSSTTRSRLDHGLLDLGLAQGGAAGLEQYNGMLYYPTFYEGLEQSKNVIYTGQEATQQIISPA